MALVSLLTLAGPARATEVPASVTVTGSGGGNTYTAPLGSGTAMLQLPSGLTASIFGTVGSGTAPGTGLYNGGMTTLGSRGYVASDYAQGLAGATPAANVIVNATNNCPASGACAGLGTLTIAFNVPVKDPVINLAGIGANIYTGKPVIRAQSSLHSILTLATAGLTLTELSGGNLEVRNGTTITAVNDNAGIICASATTSSGALAAATTAACGSVRINGTVTTVKFDVSAYFTQTQSGTPGESCNNVTVCSGSGMVNVDDAINQDGFTLTVSVPEDFGDAPATTPYAYDTGTDGAARAILSDITLGAGVTEDNGGTPATLNATVSPNASTTASLDGNDDGVTFGPLVAGSTGYSVPVTIAGASNNSEVCGWIDLDKDGDFDTPTERACAPVIAGQTTATLSWTGISGLTEGTTYARFRVGYDTVQQESPTGPSSSGEVEDYRLTIAPAPVPNFTLAKTADPASGTTVHGGDTVAYTVTGTNTGETALDPVTITDDLSAVLNNAAIIAGSLTASTGATPTVTDTTLKWTGKLARGEQVVLSYKVKINDAVPTGTIIDNHASATAQPPTGPPINPPDVETRHPAEPKPWVVTPTPTPTPAPVVTSIASVTPAAPQVLGARASLRGTSGCVKTKFDATVNGRRIKTVVWMVDGRRISTMRKPTARAKRVGASVTYRLTIDPRKWRAGAHRVTAKVTFLASSNKRAKTLTFLVQRCVVKIKPRFTG